MSRCSSMPLLYSARDELGRDLCSWARVRSAVRRLGLTGDVRFPGAKPWPELAALYAMADVFALPSSFDNSPNALLEAMACGLPVVATRVGGVPRYVADGENGLL